MSAITSDAVKRFWEPRLSVWQVQVLPGDVYVTDTAEVIATVLGSCVSACVRDRVRGLGGINHFMLPHDLPGALVAPAARARYGTYALECLLDEILKRGGRRCDLEVKVFGGGQVVQGTRDVGKTNIELVRRFFAHEGLPIVAQDVGGTVARRVRYWPMTGQVELIRLPMRAAARPCKAHRVNGCSKLR